MTETRLDFMRHGPPEGDQRVAGGGVEIVELGGVMGAYNGWERANWFAKPGDDTSEEATHTWERQGPWTARVKEECEAVRDHCGVLDLCGFSRFDLSGEGAAEWLRGRIAGALPKIGRMNLIYFPDSRGRILTEMSLVRKGEDDFTLITAAAAQWHDREVLTRNLPDTLTLADRTTEVVTMIVTGPKSRDVLAGICDADLSLGWLTHQDATCCGKSVKMIRVSFAGELGWEVHAANADAPEIYAALTAAGAKPFGMFALDSLRLEKGYRTWKGDLSTDYTLLEGGLGRFVKLDKPQGFPGKAALMNEKQQGSKKAFATLIVEAGAADAPYMSTIWHGDEVVGETTSGGFGYRIGKSIALAVVKPELAGEGTELEVEIYGARYKATVQADEPLWDPANERIRA